MKDIQVGVQRSKVNEAMSSQQGRPSKLIARQNVLEIDENDLNNSHRSENIDRSNNA